MPTLDGKQRRHDERVQHEILAGLARILDVLHDISDSLQELVRDAPRPATDADDATPDNHPILLSVNDAAELLGIAPSSVRNLCANGHGPPITRLGRRVYIARADLDSWVDAQRQDPTAATIRWRTAYTPGRIGLDVPATTESRKLPWCTGSHTEPTAASAYSGRGICRICKDDVLINRNGLLRKHRRWGH